MLKDSSGGAELMDEAFGVGARIRVLPRRRRGFLPRLAMGYGEAIVVAFNAHTCEYTAKALSMHSRLHTKIPYCAVGDVSRNGNEELKIRCGSLRSEGVKTAVQAECAVKTA
jgi:hypothetical protein